MVGNVSWAAATLVEGVEHVEGFGEYKQPFAKGDGRSYAAILNALKAMSWATTELYDPAEVDRIIAEQQKANQALHELDRITETITSA